MAKSRKTSFQAVDYLFETSWEVCNKVGGIHTVVATKAKTIVDNMGDNYVLIGPDIHREGNSPEFAEDTALYKELRQSLYQKGVRIKVGRWKVEGSPVVILVDFTYLFAHKDEFLAALWETYKVDSISGQWDYIEPVLFGRAAGEVIEAFVSKYSLPSDIILAHFHEWMTSSGGLYLRHFVPRVATVFSTHATVLGRSLAGNGYPLYGGLAAFNGDEMARHFDVTAKHSLEKTAANMSDAFLTVSDITARECKYLLGKEVDVVTPNGFEDDFVWQGEEFDAKRTEARKIMISVAEACLDHKFKKDPIIVGTSGRYEYKNKGLDVFLEALKQLAAKNRTREILAYITVPAGNHGARADLAAHLADPAKPIDRSQLPYTTHYLSNPACDPIVSSLNGSVLLDNDSNVKIIFVPTYLDGNDGIFNKHYYELLVGMDLTVYASYYEPWGYTPLESVAFSVPTITTSLAGFGAWAAKEAAGNKGVTVVERTDLNTDETIDGIASCIDKFIKLNAEKTAVCRKDARALSEKAQWSHFIKYYSEGYRMALENALNRLNSEEYDDQPMQVEVETYTPAPTSIYHPTWTRMMVDKKLPDKLHPLEVISHNLLWSWLPGVKALFESIDPQLWHENEHNPITFLDKLSYARIMELEKDTAFLKLLDEVYAHVNEYLDQKKQQAGPSIAYFSMEYGLHSSLKIYSGGLGILAGDYLKEASDMNVPMVAVGLLYRYGYFTQKLSAQGEQEAAYEAQRYDKLPISPVRDDKGNWVTVQIALPGRNVTARAWKCDVGRTDLYLLDTDHEMNLDEDRSITHHLYGGDWENRLKQEMLLGLGGIRLLEMLNINQDVYHCNEGHAAFIGLERIKNLMQQKELSYRESVEVVRSSSLFTTHTPVPAGHDAFDESMMRQYLSHYAGILGISWNDFMNLGREHPNNTGEKFSMSALACRLSQEVNGVSWLHGEVSKEILGDLWPGYFKDELHIGYVTNGVHFPTWTASSLIKLYNEHFPEGFSLPEYNRRAWQKIHEVDDAKLWKERVTLKERLIQTISKRMSDPKQLRYDTPATAMRAKEQLGQEMLTIGFARRFATYKRAYLLFRNLDRLEKIVNNEKCPVRFLFAGKAHPNDKPGQDLIKRIVEVSNMPQFVGKIIFLQNYDMNLARRMVQGVDVWLNTPTRPLEASGTSGQKCVMNGVLQFSVLDGWWVEGYKEDGGWMLPMEQAYQDGNYQDELDAEMIYATIEEQIVPLYYARSDSNIPHGWVKRVKNCVADIASAFTTNRMFNDYENRFYRPLAKRHSKIKADNYKGAREFAAWKQKVSDAWDDVRVLEVKKFNMNKERVEVGHKYDIEVKLDIGGALSAHDIGVEFVLAEPTESGHAVKVVATRQLSQKEIQDREVVFAGELAPQESGTYDFSIRIYPKNEQMVSRMDLPLVKWV